MGGPGRSTDAVVRPQRSVSNSCARTWRPSRCRPGRYAVSAFLKLASAFAHEAPQWASNSSLARRASSSDRCARREHDRWGRRTPSSSGRCRDPRAAHRGSPLPACQATPSLALPTGASVRIGWPSITTGKPAVRHRLTSDPGPPSRQLSPNSRAPCQARERVNARALRSDPTYAAGCGRHRVRDRVNLGRNQSSLGDPSRVTLWPDSRATFARRACSPRRSRAAARGAPAERRRAHPLARRAARGGSSCCGRDPGPRRSAPPVARARAVAPPLVRRRRRAPPRPGRRC